MKDTETIDRLFLELSQFTTATTGKEIRLQLEAEILAVALHKLIARARTHVPCDEARKVLDAYRANHPESCTS